MPDQVIIRDGQFMRRDQVTGKFVPASEQELDVIQQGALGTARSFVEGALPLRSVWELMRWQNSREHLTITWDADGSGVASPAGMLRAFWKARPYSAIAFDLKRKPVYLEIGQATSGSWSPLLKKNLALASVFAEHAEPGQHLRIEVTAEYHRRTVEATVTPMPFFNPERKRGT